MTAQRSKPRAQPASKQKLRLWIRLLGASRTIEAELRRRLRAEFGETLPRFDVMAALQRRPHGMIMTELSRYLMVSNGNVTGIVERLVAEGHVMRLAVEDDRRATFVRLTPKGTQHFAAMARVHETWVSELLAHFDSSETDTLIELLATRHPPALGT